MKQFQKKYAAAALTLIAGGILIALCGMLAMGFDFTRMNTLNFVTNTYDVDEAFSDISVVGAECDIRLLPSEDGTCQVVCTESDRIDHSVEVVNGTLNITRHDRRSWYMHFGVYWGSMEILVYLPVSELGALNATSVSGNIEIPEDFSFETAALQTTSGDITCFAPVKKDLSAGTTSGNIRLGGSVCETLSADSTSGSINISDVRCLNADAGTVSGSLKLSGVVADEFIRTESVSGDIDLYRCDADALILSSTSGDIEGSLLTDKSFDANTTSGDVSLPQTSADTTCEVSTVSGDITFSIRP